MKRKPTKAYLEKVEALSTKSVFRTVDNVDLAYLSQLRNQLLQYYPDSIK